jgi:energy-coupling factor transport system ATP-binding protein
VTDDRGVSPAVVVRNLTFTHRGSKRPALVDINLTIPTGTFVAVMGQASSGKSTLCLSLNGLIPRHVRGRLKGSVVVRGIDLRDAAVADIAQVVGLVFQDFEYQLVSTSVELEVAFGPENHAIPRAELRRRVDKYLELVGLSEFRDREPSSLSGGEKQRLAIASVLALEPDVVVMDEPTTDLDSSGRDEVLRIARDLNGAGRTLVMVEHDAEMATAADQVVLMREGRVLACGETREVLSDVQLLAHCGVRPPQLAELFTQLGSPEIPLTVEEGLTLVRASNHPVRRVATPAPARAYTAVIVEARGASYAYEEDGTPALQDLQLTIREGEFVAVVGQNGSGKTTLGKLLSGLLQPSEGAVIVGGMSVGSLERAAFARLVGFVFQNPDSQIFSPTVQEEVSFALRNFGVPENEIRYRVAESLRAVGLDGYERRDPFSLTKGERQRVAVASVLTSRPRVLILDEPTTGLDYGQQVGMMEMLVRLNRAGHTIVIITHSMWASTDYAPRTIVMHDGRILLDAPTRHVFTRQDILGAVDLCPPPVVELSNCLRVGALTVHELAAALRY